jgi:hypothetical protein
MLKFCGKDFTDMTSYKLIQLTNTTVGAVDVNENIPFGTVTRRINAPYSCCNTFVLASSNTDTVTINDTGFYKITYSLSAVTAAAGTVTTSLMINGTSVYSVSAYAADADSPVNVTLPYVIRVCPSGTTNAVVSPVTVQVQNSGAALTGNTSNIIIEKI